MADETHKTYLYSYPFGGSQWSFELMAKDADEAQERLKALAWAKLDGELHLRIPVPAGRLIARIIAWWRR